MVFVVYSSMKTTFIYALCEPGTRTIRYVGKSNRPERRLKGHCCGSVKHKSHLGDWLRKLKSQGKKPALVVLQEVSSSEWKTAEERYIRAARMLGMDLVNGTDGGDGGEAFNQGPNHPQFGLVGPSSHNFGRKHSDEARRNMRLAHLGHKPSEETKNKTRGINHVHFGKKGPLSHNFGRKHSKEEIARRSQSIKEAWAKRKKEEA